MTQAVMHEAQPRSVAQKERGILFSAPMVRAILAGRKTVTRRIVKPQGPTEAAVRARCGTGYHYFTDHHAESPAHFRVAGPVSVVRDLGGPTELRCPYGEPGDRLWVRETWRRSLNANAADACGGAMGTSFAGPEFEYFASAKWPRMGGAWKPSIHMPRHASRLTLEVTDIRVERLQEITDEEVFAEGLDMNHAGTLYVDEGEDGLAEFAEPRDAFAFLWDGINGKRTSWESNPWVWRVEFRRVPSNSMEGAAKR